MKQVQFDIPSVEVMGKQIPGTFWYAYGPKLWEFKSNEKYKDVPEEAIQFAKWVGIKVNYVVEWGAANPYANMVNIGGHLYDKNDKDLDKIRMVSQAREKELLNKVITESQIQKQRLLERAIQTADFTGIIKQDLKDLVDLIAPIPGPLQEKLTIDDLDIMELKHTFKVINKRNNQTIEYPKRYVLKMQKETFYEIAIKQFERGVPKDGIPPRMPIPDSATNYERW